MALPRHILFFALIFTGAFFLAVGLAGLALILHSSRATTPTSLPSVGGLSDGGSPSGRIMVVTGILEAGGVNFDWQMDELSQATGKPSTIKEKDKEILVKLDWNGTPVFCHFPPRARSDFMNVRNGDSVTVIGENQHRGDQPPAILHLYKCRRPGKH